MDQPIDLTGGTRWEYRAVVDGAPRTWCAELADAVAGLVARREAFAAWPTRWTAFGSLVLRGGLKRDDPAQVPDFSTITSIPEVLRVGEQVLGSRVVEVDAKGQVDLGQGQQHGITQTAYLLAEMSLAERTRLTVHCGADYWMHWWVDGTSVFDTIGRGNRGATLYRAWEFELDLSPGKHLLAGRVVSGSGGWALASEATRIVEEVREDVPFTIEARRVFGVDDPARFGSLSLVSPAEQRPMLNGQIIPLPFEGVRYDGQVPGIPVSMLRRGRNELTRTWDAPQSRAGARVLGLRYFDRSGDAAPVRAEGGLLGFAPGAARIHSGPVLGRVGIDRFTVSCRTNMVTPVTLRADGREMVSTAALIHRFELDGFTPGQEIDYELAAGEVEASRRCGRVRIPDPARGLSIAVVSDAGPLPQIWTDVANAILPHKPDLLVFGGDIINDGRNYYEWDYNFIDRSPELLATTPLYVVQGNHEQRSPLIPRLFMLPGDSVNWAQRIGPVLLVAIHGDEEPAREDELLAWLEKTLATNDAKHIFLFNHFPAWSSGGHTRAGADGRPVERATRLARERIMPVCARYGVAAVFSGHDHAYERSEPPGGPTAIVSAGAGAFMYAEAPKLDQNPHCKTLVSAYHFCLLHATDERCVMRALDVKGTVIDQKEWRARGAG